MKKSFYRIVTCVLLIAAAVMSGNATHRMGETFRYQLCQGDTLTLTTRNVQVHKDTILYDTLVVAGTPEADSIFNTYEVNLFPSFAKTEYKRLSAGDSFEWLDTIVRDAGVYERVYHSIHGCDSIYRLTLDTYLVDTIDTTVVLCPSETITWHGITAGTTGDYERKDTRANGDYIYCRLHLTVKELMETERTFSICDEETVTFNGQVYANAGTYYNQYTCDTLYKLIITKHPTQLHLQYGVLGKEHPYYWQYQLDGEAKTDTLNTPGVYEYTTQNPETGCNDIWRLILRKDETSYRFDTVATVCENEYFEWRGKKNLNLQGIGTTTDYYDNYKTQAGYDSIYHLALTVQPVKRITQTIPFCGSITWKGQTYTKSETLIDTLTSIQYGCDSIITTILAKGIPFAQHDTATIVPGETLLWHEQTITSAGQYEDKHLSHLGCDSVYTLGVGMKAASETIPILTERASTCEGTPYHWRNKDYTISGRYVDTVFVGSTQEIDSLIVLELTVNQTYAWTERISFTSFPQTYRGENITAPGTYSIHFTTYTGCDSILTLYVDREIIRDDSTVIICPNETFIWRGKERHEGGRFVEVEKDALGNDSVEHVLNLTVRYIPETHLSKTICKGSSYTFGEQLLTESGVYTHTFKQDGCDSTVILSLNVVSPDTIRYVHHMNAGDSYEWHNETYRETGVVFFTTTNRFGCDSTEMLILTVNHVDTIDSTATICPGETLEWHGIRASQSGDFANAEQQSDGSFNYYRLHLTVRELAQVDSTFILCGDEELSFNGKTYTEAGHFYDKAGCDTLYHLYIQRIPSQVFITNASLSKEGGYTWTYKENGVEKTDVFNTPGTYEFRSTNGETGCQDIYRLILTKDETSYHFVETLTVCEGEDFTWRGMSNLSGQPGTSHYFDSYQTRAGKDSIYELVLTVTPIKRTIQTTTFCGEFTWKGQTYTNSTILYDTITSSTGCDSIVRMNFDKITPFYRHDTATIVQGETLLWHGQAISGDGFYTDAHTNQYGCDSIYTLGVGVIAATPQTNMFTTQYSICDGDVYTWRGHDYAPTTTTTYIDTVYKAGTNNIDSIFVLKLTVHTNYSDTIVRHLYTCGEVGASIRYQGKEYYEDTTLITNLHTLYGCDSIVKVYLHFNTALFLTDTVEIADTELPYTWNYRLGGSVRDTVLTAAGTYDHFEPAEGTCVNHEQLVLLVYPTYLYEQDTTICELDLPFYWLKGPSEHVNDALQHTVGQTKQYEYRYQTVNHTDSIYRLHLTIDPAPQSTERHYVCEGSPKKIHGVTYGQSDMTMDTLYRDTLHMHVDGTVCDSTIYVEVYVSSIKTHTETVVLQDGDTIEWNGMHITSGGEYRFTTDSVGIAGCDSISILRVIQELGDERIICSNDTGADVHPDKKYPLVWEHPHLTHAPDTLYTSGSFRDTVFDDLGYILEIYRMDLTVVHPYDTTIVVHGCQNKGALWRDELYYSDTAFVDRVEVIPHTHEQPCDSVFHVTIKIDTVYNIRIDTTLCEYQLPLIIGRVNPDTIWAEGNFKHEGDKTLCGCDSTIEGHLTIIPKLTRNDSTFVCQSFLDEGGRVILGDTVTPAFINNDGGIWADKWQGKWRGVEYSQDTIVWDCDHRYFHHIIVRPSQTVVKDTTIYLCPDDTLQLFWPRDDSWFYKDTIYEEHVPMTSYWKDEVHNYAYANDAYTCDSVTIWNIKKLPLYHKDTTAHRLLGDSIWWGGAWRYYTGTYDSIAPSPDTSSLGDTCMYIYPLHLIVDTAYYFRDTVDVCTVTGKTHTYIWPETGHKQFFTVGAKDTLARHYIDSLITYDRRDSIYDLCVNYRLQRDTTIYRTICEDDSLRFDLHHRDNVSFTERWVKNYGTYYDTVMAANGCDSIITLKLTIHPRIITKPKEVMITNREIPYLWHHAWTENSLPVDSTDTLRATGLYTFVMPSIHGCDSIDSLYLTVHQTHVFRDTIDVCDRLDKTRSHTWSTGYIQTYNTPLADDTAFYADTLQTRILFDSIYVLCINFHQTYEIHLYDTICAGDSVQLGAFYKTTGIYHDTVPAINGCDSVITLHLQVWPNFPTRYRYEDINVVDTPFAWVHTWVENGTLQQDIDYLSIPGEYGRVLPTIHGCDSIDSLILRIHENYTFYDTVRICSDETPYTWLGSDYTVYKSDIYDSGDYVRRWRTENGFGDSTRMLHVEVLPVVYSQRYDTLCYGDSILFGLTKLNQPHYLKQSGVYYDTLTSIRYGCDSIIEMRLNVFGNYLHTETRHIMRTDTPYVWYHFRDGATLPEDSTIITGEGIFGYNFVSLHGCDSIDSLMLVLHDDYLYRDSVVICQDQVPYTWYGADNTIYKQGIDRSGEYTYSLRKQDGHSDSTLVRKVTILPIMYSQRYDTLCYGDSILFGLTKLNQPRYLKQSGVYYDTLTSIQYGCDSIIEMRLNVFPHLDKYHAAVDITDHDLPYTWYHFRDGEDVAIDSTKIFGSGEFTYTFSTIHGCDSVDHLTVNVHPNYLFRDTVIICSDATPYTWYGLDGTVFKSDIYLTDLYTRHMRTADGFADSIYTRYVDVQQVKLTVIRDSICQDVDGNNFYTFKGQNLTVGGIYRDTLTAASGCDSIIELHLSVNKPYYSFREEHIIEGQSVTAYGLTFTSDTLFVQKGLTPSGCDSTTVLKVVVHPLVDTVVTVCSADLPYLWLNKWNGSITPLYAAGFYRNDTTFVEGQRMYYGLRLIVNQPTDTTIYRAICEEDEYNFNGRFLTEAGEYRDTLHNAAGCDSIVVLHLNVNPKYRNVINRTIYEGDSVIFEGEAYSTAGIYPIRLTSSTGCDSIIELRLTVNRLYDDSVSICSNELPYIWRDKRIYESGIYRDTIPNSNGADAVIGIKVNVLPTFRATEPTVVSICEGDFYKFGGAILTEQGTYYDTLTAINGCDSIVMLSLQVMPLKYQSETRRIFEGDSVQFDGQWLKESGVYERRVQNANGCTDTYQLILTVLREFRVDTTAYICKNDIPFLWRGYEYSASGDYSLPTAWTDSSRVVTTLHLNVYETFYEERNIAICSGDEFRYKDRLYTTNGEFFDTIPSLVGCDSIIKYVISVHPTYDHSFEKHISDKQPYEFHGRTLTNTGTYEWTGKTVAGCDSVEHLTLIVHPSFFHSDTIELCQSDSLNYPFQWKDEDGRLIRTITESGVYNDSVLTEYGFDSVHQVVVHVHPSYFIKEKYEIGEGEILKIHGRDISKPAVYYDTLRTIHGCDSIYHIVVNPKTTREFTWNKIICHGDYFDFFGEKKTNTGRYTYTSQYKDSIVYLNLTVNPVSYSEKRIIITDKQTSYIYDGQLYTDLRLGENLFTKTMVNQYGCDSIHRLIICVTQRYSDWDPIPLCPGGEVKIDGKIITQAGLYTFERRSRVTGELDSLYRVEVYDAPAFDLPLEKATICQGDTFLYAGKKITRGGHYDFALKTISGCDSLLHLDLTVNPSYQFYTDATIADYETYSWRGKSYAQTGNYDVSFPTILDCDSTYTLRLTVIETKRQLTDDTICVGQTYNWRGHEITEEGIYTDTIRQLETGFSAIYTLKLTILYPTTITSATVGEVCADGESFDIAFTYTGAKPTNYSIYFDQLAKNEGFKDVLNQPFLGEDRIARAPVPSKKEVIYLEHTAYVKPNRYSMRLVLDNGVCGISRSDSLVLLVRYPSWIIEQNWNDVVAPLRKEYNGGYEFAQADWYVNGVLQPNNSLGYLHSDKLKEGDEVIMVATRKGESFSIPTCPLVIRQNAGNVYTNPILVYPTQAPHHAPHITIEAPQGGQYAIFSSTGALISDGTLEVGATRVTLPGINGIYFIRTSVKEDTQTHKVILY